MHHMISKGEYQGFTTLDGERVAQEIWACLNCGRSVGISWAPSFNAEVFFAGGSERCAVLETDRVIGVTSW